MQKADNVNSEMLNQNDKEYCFGTEILCIRNFAFQVPTYVVLINFKNTRNP